MSKLVLLLVIALLTGFAPPAQQASAPAITLAVEAGYDGLFRENEWFPLRVEISNDGSDVTGRVVVRPGRSGNAFSNTFSAPVEMPAGSRKTVFLYVTARSFATEVRVEFIDQEDIPLAEQSAVLRNVLYQDQLHVVLTQSSVGSVDLTSVRSGGYNAFQANWQIQNIPDQMAAFDAVDTMLFSDLDTGALSSLQRTALEDWVAGGGHLIATGGANWQATAAGLTNLLPMTPDGSETIDNLDSLAALAGSDQLRGQTVITTGTLNEGAQVLAATEEGLPLLARRTLGQGTVDYLTVDPLAQPLRDWDSIGELWFTLSSTTGPQPSWARDLFDADQATNAVEVLPGLNLLPDVLPLCGFLAAYVALIGPLNYVVLNRFNRREWAWVTMPVFIVVFSILAWVVGFNLRGNTATLSRLAVVQSWPDSERAQVNGLVGLLSPRRSNYTLTMTDGSLLRPIGRSIQANPFAANIQTGTNIEQADLFRANDFTVDASFIAAFTTSTRIDRPAIGGQASLFYQPPAAEEETGRWSVRGSVRNDSTETLYDPVILARGISLPLDEPLLPGDIQTFDMPLVAITPQAAEPSLIERSAGDTTSSFLVTRLSRESDFAEQTIRDILGSDRYNTRLFSGPPNNSAEAQENYRRQLFLTSFMRDHFLSTSRGNKVYLAGWSDRMPLSTELEGAAWEPLDTTLHLIELDVEVTPPVGRVRIEPDQFTWTARERSGLNINTSPINSVLQPGDLAVFQFTPLPDAVLSTVDTLHIELNMGTSSRFDVPLELWNWETQEWQVIELEQAQDRTAVRRRSISNPQAFLGARNRVQIRLNVDENLGFLRVARLVVEQEGEF